VTVGNPAPAIALTARPTAQLHRPGHHHLHGQRHHQRPHIAKVQFYNGTTLLGEDASPPYSFTWSSVSAGSYSLTARLVYDTSSTLDSRPANVTVGNRRPLSP